jgi:hypothetical protein
MPGIVRIAASPRLIESIEFQESIQEPNFNKVFLEVEEFQDVLTINDICTQVGEILSLAGRDRYGCLMVSINAVPQERHESFFQHFGVRGIAVTTITFNEYIAQIERLQAAA